MELTVFPGQPLTGTFGPKTVPALPGDKSISHRAALFAALAQGESRITNFMVSGVTQVLLQALTQLGIVWQLDGTTLYVKSPGFRNWKIPSSSLHCGNSATTMRLLAGALAAAGIPAVLDGSQSLRRRPMARIITPLQQMGVPITGTANGTAPLILGARSAEQSLQPIKYDLPVPSAQVKTSILLAALAAPGENILHEQYRSRDHTEIMLAAQGINLTSSPQSGPFTNRITLETIPDQNLQPFELDIPGDFSSAAFLIVAALITPGSLLKLNNIGLNPTRTGLLDALVAMGAKISVFDRQEKEGEARGDLTINHSRLHGTQIDGRLVVRMIDEFPVLAVAAAYSRGSTQVREAQELRYKESDRISALCAELRNVGVAIEELPDGFAVLGQSRLLGGTVSPHRDHRLAMSLAVAGLASQNPIIVQDADIIHESFPALPEILRQAGARLTIS